MSSLFEENVVEHSKSLLLVAIIIESQNSRDMLVGI